MTAPENHAGQKQDLEPGLYLVATPIGNLRDITMRALDVLGAADLVLAEDTRHSRRLFDAYGINPHCTPYHEHNAERKRESILERLENGARIALISDAGTPLISDPGYKLVRAATARGLGVYAVPGACAALAGLSVSGLPTNTFFFAGFLPAKTAARQTALQALKTTQATLVFYESPARIMAALADMHTVLGPRPAVLARELTKRFEHIYRADLSTLPALIPKDEVRGEMVVLVGPPDKDATVWDKARTQEALRAALETHSLKDAVDLVTGQAGLRRRAVYALALALQKNE